ncbi:TetR/AcrR family transcriptional regulator [Streptomyces qinzhouensis]|uniref:TetR/AcrR family transcriptional regulator n=1 Tax=Streptomyces qinzhouensis TaxID=2599401 RepID=A0A5B8JII6_9ACTN|nr:TetR/AcrR family transcriptional regulator [Streptomyces qinzhouensis]QDY80194.1 TetR/AcrR family transcriptional regulator [Streptomyces qinzhouensis]
MNDAADRTGPRTAPATAEADGGQAAVRAGSTRRAVTRRPPDRKERIVVAAAGLFRDRGYHNVSVADVAGAVGITAPALYRHFRGKPDLLAQVVDRTVGTVTAATTDAPDLDTYLATAAAHSIERRGAAVIWQREARHLPEEHRERAGQALSAAAGRIGELIGAERPELSTADRTLLAWAVLSVAGSISWHRTSLPRRRFEEVLLRLATAAVRCELGTADAVAESGGEGPGGPGAYAVLAVSRREEILGAAIRLFDERGFQSVSTDDIGEAAGASGPSIYKHFPTKTDLLIAGIVRGGEQRRAGTERALRTPGTPDETLARLLRAYVDFALGHAHLIGLILGELDQLPEKERRSTRQVQREYLALWGRLLEETRPGTDPAEARIVVSAVLTVVDNAVRTGRLGARPDLGDRLVDIGTALLHSH